MADKQIGALTAASALDGTETFHLVQGGNSRKATASQISAAVRFKNFVWNGGFQVWQRGISFNSFASRKHTADGWSFARTSFTAGSTISQQAGTNARYCIRVQRNAADSATQTMSLVGNLSRDDSAPLIGQACTLTFRARMGADFSAASASLSAIVQQNTDTNEQAITAANGQYSPGNSTAFSTAATLTTSWQEFTVSGTFSASMIQAAIRFSWVPVGTAGAADYVEIETVKLEVGSVKTPFVLPQFAETLAIAQRWFRKSYNYDTTPGTATTEGARREIARGTESPGAVNIGVEFMIPMRANPTVTLYSPSTGASAKMYDGTGDINATTANIGTNGFIATNNAATTSGNTYSVHWTAESAL